jgi:hypothetical protein
VLELSIGRTVILDLQGGAGRQRPRLEALLDPCLEPLEIGDRRTPHDVAGGRVRRDDVGRIASVGDNAVDLVAGVQMLAKEPDPDLGHRDGVGCVDTLLGGASDE